MQNKKIKILRIITRLNIGGPAIHASLLTKEFNDIEFESKLVCGRISKREGDMGYVARDYGVEPIYVSSLRREISPFSDIAAFFRIVLVMLRYRPDIVHTHTAKAGTLGRIAAILTGVPVKIHTFHGNVFQGYFKTSEASFFMFAERVLAKFTNAIIAISQSQKKDIVEKYRITEEKKCHVIQLGFDLQKFLNPGQKRKAFREKYKLKDNDIFVGIIGRLVPIKNHKMFIDAVYHMNKNSRAGLTDRIKFVIIGDGYMKEEVLAYSKFRGLREKILCIGWARDIDEVYAGLDIVALTSINEGTPVSLIEAMSSEKPVVSTDVGGVRDALGEAGILVKSEDYKRLGEEISLLAASPEKREKLGRLGRDFVKTRFSKERLVSELKELYRNLLTRRGK